MPRRVPLLIAIVLFVIACALCETRQMIALQATARIALGAALLAVPIGVFMAAMFVKTNLPGQRFRLPLLATLLLTPLHVHTAGWETLFGKLGWWTIGHGGPERALLAGEGAAIWIHAAAAWPWVALIVAVGLATVDAACEDAARMTRSPLEVFFAITLPWIAPFILLAALWTVVSVAGEMTVANIYFLRTYADEVYTQFALESSPEFAWRTMLPGMLFLAAGLSAGLALLPEGRTLFASNRTSQFRFQSLATKRTASVVVWSLLAAVTLIPLAGLVHRAGVDVVIRDGARERHWSPSKAARIVAESPRKYGPEFRDTLRVAAGAATLAMLLLVGPIFAAHSAGRSITAAWLLAIPALIPGPLVGMTLIPILNRPELPLLADLYQRSSLAPILAVLTRAAPVAGWVLLAAFAATPRDTVDSAKLLGRSFAARLWLLIRGCHWPALAAAWLAAFAVAAGDLSSSILVLPPGVYPVAFRIFGLLHSGADDQVAGMCLTFAAGTFLAGWGLSAAFAAVRQRT